MLKSYLKIVVRNLINHRSYSAVNILGLAVGMACCILAVLYIDHEFGYNLNHEKADRLYRVIRQTRSGGQTTFGMRTSGGLGNALRNDYPEVEQAVRLLTRTGWVQYGEKVFRQRFCLADKNILKMFDFPLIQGDAETVFEEPQTVLITQELAQKLFGAEDPIGKTIAVEEDIMGYDYKVAGVLRDMPARTTLQFDILSTTVEVTWPEVWVDWIPAGYRHIENYVLLKEGHDPGQFEAKLSEVILHQMGEKVYADNRYRLQPFERIYLYSNRDYGLRSTYLGDIAHLYLFALIAAFILLIGCVNFVNLTTARAFGRAWEVGLRKVVGAHRRQLIVQFLGESTLLSFLALALALAMVLWILPTFNVFVERQIVFQATNIPVMVGILGLTFCVGVVAGSYPAFFLSAFQPAAILKGVSKSGQRSVWLRKSLVVSQFAISVLLMIFTWAVYNQGAFLKNKSLGFTRDQVIELPLFSMAGDTELWGRGWQLKEGYNAVKEAFSRHPHVLQATTSWFSMGQFAVSGAFRTADADERFMQMLGADEDFLDFYGIELTAGANFTRLHAETTNTERRDQKLEEQFILNETAVRQLGWTDPIGKRLIRKAGGTFWENGLRPGAVIGVVKDFHFKSLREKVAPLVLVAELRNTQYLHLKINPRDLSETLAFLQSTWKHYLPNRPFTFSFLDDKLNDLYRDEARLSQLFSAFALLAVFVACLGLYGLATSSVEQRTKEIGIRKILGASISNLFLLVVKDFIKLVFLANLIVCPIAYYAMNQWLQNFAYRIEPGAEPFLFVGVLTIVTAVATVSFRSLQAAATNPVDSLRCE